MPQVEQSEMRKDSVGGQRGGLGPQRLVDGDIGARHTFGHDLQNQPILRFGQQNSERDLTGYWRSWER